jgi:V8-like Glu-specific endopeptidase
MNALTRGPVTTLVVVSLLAPVSRADAAGTEAVRYWTSSRMREAIRNSAEDNRARATISAGRGQPTLAPARPGMKAIGRVYGVKADGSPWSCTGTLVDSANRSLVWTAGHCVHPGRGGDFYTNIVFAPAEQPAASGNRAPYGVWPAVHVGTTGSWARKGISRSNDRRAWRTAQYDGAALVLGVDSAGRRVDDVVGVTQHIRFRVRRSRAVRMIGYPDTAPYNGEALVQCGPARTWAPRYAIRLLGVPCRGIGPGMSGGPAIAHMNELGVGSVIGEMTLTDLRRMFVSYQGREMRKLYRQVSEYEPVQPPPPG